MKNSDLHEKKGSLYFFKLYIKMSETTYYERNRDVIVNRAKDYNKNDKERLRIMREINTEIYWKRKKTKRDNMEKIDIICLKKRNKN